MASPRARCAVPMSRDDEIAAIDRHIAERGVMRCPPLEKFVGSPLELPPSRCPAPSRPSQQQVRLWRHRWERMLAIASLNPELRV